MQSQLHPKIRKVWAAFDEISSLKIEQARLCFRYSCQTGNAFLNPKVPFNKSAFCADQAHIQSSISHFSNQKTLNTMRRQLSWRTFLLSAHLPQSLGNLLQQKANRIRSTWDVEGVGSSDHGNHGNSEISEVLCVESVVLLHICDPKVFEKDVFEWKNGTMLSVVFMFLHFRGCLRSVE